MLRYYCFGISWVVNPFQCLHARTRTNTHRARAPIHRNYTRAGKNNDLCLYGCSQTIFRWFLKIRVLFVVDSSSIGWLMHFNFTFDFWLAKILGSPSLFRTERHNFRFTYTRRSLEFRCYFSVWPSIFPAIRAAFRPYAAAILYSRCERALSAVLLA